MQNRLTLLDICTNGDLDKLNNLIGPVHVQFNTLYNIIKSGMIELSDIDNPISFNILNNTATFDISCTRHDDRIDNVNSLTIINDGLIRLSMSK